LPLEFPLIPSASSLMGLMGSSDCKNVQPTEFYEAQGLSGLPDDATKQDIFELVADPDEPFQLSKDGAFIYETGMSREDLSVGNMILQHLQPGVGQAEADGGDPLAQMLRNFDNATKEFKKEKKSLTLVNGQERDRSVQVETYDLKSVNDVAEALLASLIMGFGVPVGLSKALVIPKVAEFLRGLSEVYKSKKEGFNLGEFIVQFVCVNSDMKCTSVSAYRFRFSSSADKTKYWLFANQTDNHMYVHCKKVAFLCTRDVDMDDILS